MEYDYRSRTGPTYDSQIPMYNRPTASATSSSHPTYGYPKVGQHTGNPLIHPGAGRPHQTPPPSSSSSGIGIRVVLKPEYRITPPPQLSPQTGDIPRSNFQFDFEFERKILAEAEKESPSWSRLGLENFPSKAAETSSLGSTTDLVVRKYVASGLSREAVPHAVANYGDNPTKVREFVNGYIRLREMGFSSDGVVEALLMYDNDTDKALAYLLK